MLESKREVNGRPVTTSRPIIEREVVAMLRRPSGYPPTVEGIVRKLLSSFSESEVQKAITNLIRDGKVEAVYGNKLKESVLLIPSPLKASRKLH